jgi:hypothetical protein
MEAAALGTGMPGQFEYPRAAIALEGQVSDPAQQRKMALRAISPGLLDLLRIPVLQGRDFNEHDALAGDSVVLLDRPAAERLFPGEDALGHRVAVTTAESAAPRWATIVGIVGSTQHFAQLGGPDGAIYTNWFSAPTPLLPMVYLRGDQHSRLTLDTATHVIRRFDPAAAVLTPAQGSYARQIAASYWNFEWRGNAMAAFASVAHLVAAVGIFGLVAYMVAERTREIGIRQALGATRGNVVCQVAWRGLRLVLGGCAVGVFVTIALSQSFPQYVRSLYKMSPYDPTVYGTVLVALLIAGSLACWLPARRAAKIDPVVALRAE